MNDTGTNHTTDGSMRDEAPAEGPSASSEPTLIEGAALGRARAVESPAPPAELPAAPAESLLCEGCGYSIEGLAEAALCPECGMVVGNSLPSRRRGSAWERSPTPRARKAMRRTMRRNPDRVFRSLTFSEDAAFELIATTIGHVTLWTVLGFMVPIFVAGVFALLIGGLLVSVIVVFPILGIVFLLLRAVVTSIELGLVAWARAMGWRATRRVIHSVAAHAYGSMPRFAPLWFCAGLSPWLFLVAVAVRAPEGLVYAMVICPPLLIAGPPLVLAHKRLLRGVYLCRFANVPTASGARAIPVQGAHATSAQPPHAASPAVASTPAST